MDLGLALASVKWRGVKFRRTFARVPCIAVVFVADKVERGLLESGGMH